MNFGDVMSRVSFLLIDSRCPVNYKEFKSAVKRCKEKHPVILLEGKRAVLPEDRERLISRSSLQEGASGANI